MGGQRLPQAPVLSPASGHILLSRGPWRPQLPSETEDSVLRCLQGQSPPVYVSPIKSFKSPPVPCCTCGCGPGASLSPLAGEAVCPEVPGPTSSGTPRGQPSAGGPPSFLATCWSGLMENSVYWQVGRGWGWGRGGRCSALRELAVQRLQPGLHAQPEWDLQDRREAFGQCRGLELLPVGGGR